MTYTAPNIKDRVAAGDDKFITVDLGGGRIQLIPDPDSVTEQGTDINKAVLQPLVDTVELNQYLIGSTMKNGIISGFDITPPESGATVAVGAGTYIKDGVLKSYTGGTHNLKLKSTSTGTSKGILYFDGTILRSEIMETTSNYATICYPALPEGSILLAKYYPSQLDAGILTESKQVPSMTTNYGTQAHFEASIYRTADAARADSALSWVDMASNTTEKLTLVDNANITYNPTTDKDRLTIHRDGRYQVCVQGIILGPASVPPTTRQKITVLKNGINEATNNVGDIIGGGHVVGVTNGSLLTLCSFEHDFVANDYIIIKYQNTIVTGPPNFSYLKVKISKIGNPQNPNER